MSKEKECKWVFDPQSRGDETGPSNAADLRFRGTIYTSLIRESIQNSMDAALKNDDGSFAKVRVDFDFRNFTKRNYGNFLEIINHIKGCLETQQGDSMAERVFQPMINTCSAWEDEIGFLRVSDYNTKGMEYKSDDKNCPFYAFAHSEGKTVHDNNDAGGAFGFGKTVFWTLSPINTVFVTTKTTSGTYFQGISKLCTHKLPGTDQDLARVGLYDTNGSGNPINSNDLIPEDFQRKKEGTGTSIFVIGMTNIQFSEHKNEMIKAVLRNFWLAIMDDKLEVYVDENEISSATIDDLMSMYFADYESTSNDNAEYNPCPFYSLVRKSMDGVEGYEEIKRTAEHLGEISLYYYKGEDAAGRVLFARKPEMTIFVSRRENAYKGVTCVFVCRNKVGNRELREMEDFGHDSWKETNWKARKNKGTEGKIIEGEYKNFVLDIIRSKSAAQDSETQAIKDLEKYLYVSTPYSKENKKKTSEKKPDNDIQETKTKPTTKKLEGLSQQKDNAVPDENGRLRANERRKHTKRHKIKIGPGNMTSVYRLDDNGKEGLFATPVELSFRSWAENDSEGVVHIIKLFSEQDIDNVCIQLFGVGADGDTPLKIERSSDGNIIQGYDVNDKAVIDYDKSEDSDDSDESDKGSKKDIVNKNPKNAIQGLSITGGQKTLKVRFNSNIKYSLRINADSLNEE